MAGCRMHLCLMSLKKLVPLSISLRTHISPQGCASLLLKKNNASGSTKYFSGKLKHERQHNAQRCGIRSRGMQAIYNN